MYKNHRTKAYTMIMGRPVKQTITSVGNVEQDCFGQAYRALNKSVFGLANLVLYNIKDGSKLFRCTVTRKGSNSKRWGR